MVFLQSHPAFSRWSPQSELGHLTTKLDFLFMIGSSRFRPAPPLPLVSSHLAGFQLLSGTLQFLPVHVAVEASWPYPRILVVWVEFASSFFFPRPPFSPAGNTYPRGFASVAEVASNPSCRPKHQELGGPGSLTWQCSAQDLVLPGYWNVRM